MAGTARPTNCKHAHASMGMAPDGLAFGFGPGYFLFFGEEAGQAY